jgi:hypothetical protein
MTDLYIPRQRDDDEVSLISMRELAPSPIEDDAFYTTSDDPSITPPLSKSSTFNYHHSNSSGLAKWRKPRLSPSPTCANLHSGTHTKIQLLRIPDVPRRPQRELGAVPASLRCRLR